MNYRMLGRTDFSVSEISLGAWSLGGIVRVRDRTSKNADPCGYGEVAEADGITIVERALALGINFIDTAPIYGDGNSELRVCKALAESGRRDVVVSTKCGVFAEDGQYMRIFTGDVILREVEKSLKRLNRTTLDIELLHSPTIAEFGDGSGWKALLELKDQGVVRFVGISVFSEPGQAREFVESGLCDVLMLKVNLLDTTMLPILELAQKHNVGVMVRESLAGGFLTGLFDENTQFRPDDQRSCWPREQVLDSIRRADRLKFLVRQDRTLAQAAIQWVLSLPGVSTVTAGCGTIAELQENAAVSDIPPLSPDELERVREAISKTS